MIVSWGGEGRGGEVGPATLGNAEGGCERGREGWGDGCLFVMHCMCYWRSWWVLRSLVGGFWFGEMFCVCVCVRFALGVGTNRIEWLAFF